MQNAIFEILPLRLRFSIEALTGTQSRDRLIEKAVSIGAFFIPLVTYVRTLAPTVYNLDSAELTIAAATGGLMRATGYPLYLLLGGLWSRIPIGDAGYRMNLFSAVCGAAGVWLAYTIMRRIGVRRTAAVAAAGLLGAAPYYWSLSLIAEVYTLQVVMMGALILLLLRWAEDPTARNLALLGGWAGLSLTHHLATVLLLPGLALYIAARAPRRLPPLSHLLAALCAFLAGLSVYLYLPYLYAGDPVFNYAGRFDESLAFHPVDLGSVSGLWWLVTGRSFASRMFAYDGAALWREVVGYVEYLSRAFFYIGVPIGLLGFGTLLRRDRRLAWMLGLMFALSAYFFIDYAVVDKDTMFLPTYLVWAVFTGLGFEAVVRRAGAVAAGRRRLILQGILLSLVIAAAALTAPGVDRSNDRTHREEALQILAAAEPEAVIFGWWETIPPLQYLQIIEGRRPDIRIINRFLISRESMYHFIQRQIDHGPIYIDEFPEEWRFVFEPVPAGKLYRLERIAHPDRAGARIGGY